MTAPSIRQDQELSGLGVRLAANILPPLCNCRNRKLGAVRRGPHVHSALIVLQVVYAIGHGAPQRLSWEVMHAGLDRLLTPCVPGVLEVANQCLLLGIGADDRASSGRKRVLLRRNVLKLCVARGMVRVGFFLFRIDPQRVVMRLQQPTVGRSTAFILDAFGLFSFLPDSCCLAGPMFSKAA